MASSSCFSHSSHVGQIRALISGLFFFTRNECAEVTPTLRTVLCCFLFLKSASVAGVIGYRFPSNRHFQLLLENQYGQADPFAQTRSFLTGPSGELRLLAGRACEVNRQIAEKHKQSRATAWNHRPHFRRSDVFPVDRARRFNHEDACSEPCVNANIEQLHWCNPHPAGSCQTSALPRQFRFGRGHRPPALKGRGWLRTEACNVPIPPCRYLKRSVPIRRLSGHSDLQCCLVS